MELSRCAAARSLRAKSRVRGGDRHGIVCAVDGARGKKRHGTRLSRSHPRNSAGVVRRRLRRGAAPGRATLSAPDARAGTAARREEYHAAAVSELAGTRAAGAALLVEGEPGRKKPKPYPRNGR